MSIIVQRRAAVDALEHRGNVDLLHEAVAQHQPEEAGAKILDGHLLLGRDVGHVLDPHGQHSERSWSTLLCLRLCSSAWGTPSGWGS